MTETFSDSALRQWLADYLVTNVGCSPDDIDFDRSMNDMGVGSRDSVVLSGELSELLGRPVSPVEFWEHPTISSLAQFLTGADADAGAEEAPDRDRVSRNEPIAVIGLGCRFPGDISGPEALWQFLCEGRSAVGEVPPDRWARFDDGSAETAAALSGTTRWGSFLSEVEAFDAGFFEISPREAAKMDPQQRLLLEVTHEALEHAGIPADSLRHTQTGVFAGACLGEYGYLASSDLSEVDAWSGTGGALSVIANRVSYFFDLRGPSITVDTACSSSTVAVHLACQSLRTGDSNLAIAAGVNLLLSPAVTRSFDQAEAMSPTGKCHAFDASADGFVRGEGCGVAVLKRLSDALRDGDRVLAVVRGTAVNQDGRSNGLMAPNPAAQMALLRTAYANAGIEPREVDYVEAHGTGTLLGDPIEARALGTVLGRGRPEKSPLLIGSVKSNLGHLEAAAGIAGFLKAVLSVQRAQIPSNLHFEKPNPHIPFDNLHLKVVAEHTDWPSTERLRRAGVSSFGFGGTNAHVVLEQAPETHQVPESAGPVTTLVISAKSVERVAPIAAALADWMAGDGAGVPLADVAHTVNHRRTRHKTFAAVCARDREQAVAGLRALSAGHTAPGVVDAIEGPRRPGTVFVFSGQGSQWAGMGRRLLADEPAFAAAVADLEPAFVAATGFSMRQVLAAGEPVDGIERIQPLLVGMQLALTELWRSYGVEPDAVIGHSMGEVTAAVVAGALSPAEGLRVIATRSRLMSRLSGQGAMALLESSAEATEALIADYPDITVAVFASPSQTVIAGPPEQVDAVIAVVDAQGQLARRIEVDVASHHPTISPILPELRTALSDLAPARPRIPLISTVGHANGTEPAFDADYWVANLREPVRFSQAVAAAAKDHATFVEISPHPLLTYAISDTLASTSSADRFIVTSAMKRGEDDTVMFRAQLAALGAMADDSGEGRLADVPPSPWLHSKFWLTNRSLSQRLPDTHPLLGVHVALPSGRDHVWQADLGTEMMPWLAEHKVNGQALMPAAVFAELALAAARDVLGVPTDVLRVSDLEVEQPLALDRQTRVTTQLAHSDTGISVEIHASSAGNSWSRHAVAHVDVPTDGLGGVAVSTGAETEILLPDEAPDHPAYCLHPLILDAALQRLTDAVAVEMSHDPAEAPYLPVSFATIRVSGHLGRRAKCRIELAGPEHAGGDYLGRIVLTDTADAPAAEITGVRLRPIDASMVQLSLAQKIFDTEWVESSAPELVLAAGAGSWLLLADTDGGADPETAALVADFTTRFGSSTRRVITEQLSDESAVREAIANVSADAEASSVGIVIFIGKRAFAGADSDGGLERARELIWSISVAARAAVDGAKGISNGTRPRLWLVTRDGLAVAGGQPGDPAIGALKGLIRTWRFPGEAARVLADEPDVGVTLVDLDSAADAVAILLRELDSTPRDDVIAWRDQHRYVERLTRATLDGGDGAAVVSASGSYIITGGLGGLGLVVTRWLASKGAGRLVLNGRTPPSESQQRALEEVASGTEIVFVPGDIASAGVAEQLVAAAEQTGRPLRGVMHAAGVSADGVVAALTREDLERVWSPKVAGALRLHAATATRPLDWWVGFSSMASLLGLPGQMAYASANAWLDALTQWRRASGLPATAINWGQWSDVGMSHSLTGSVLDPITPAEGIEALESLVGGGLTRVGVARLRLDRAAVANPEFRDLDYFTKLIDRSGTASGDRQRADGSQDRSLALAPDWSQIRPEDTIGELQTRLRAILARELRMSPEAVGMDRPFPELGLDSMMAMTILREARQLVGINMSATMLWNHPTISSLAAYLAEMLAPQQVPPDDDADLTFDSASSVLDELFDSVESASAGSESGTF
jgi:phthiocerol/phenolphthiocerol synthesis type-I polyketide synthase D